MNRAIDNIICAAVIAALAPFLIVIVIVSTIIEIINLISAALKQ